MFSPPIRQLVFDTKISALREPVCVPWGNVYIITYYIFTFACVALSMCYFCGRYGELTFTFARFHRCVVRDCERALNTSNIFKAIFFSPIFFLRSTITGFGIITTSICVCQFRASPCMTEQQPGQFITSRRITLFQIKAIILAYFFFLNK